MERPDFEKQSEVLARISGTFFVQTFPPNYTPAKSEPCKRQLISSIERVLKAAETSHVYLARSGGPEGLKCFKWIGKKVCELSVDDLGGNTLFKLLMSDNVLFAFLLDSDFDLLDDLFGRCYDPGYLGSYKSVFGAGALKHIEQMTERRGGVVIVFEPWLEGVHLFGHEDTIGELLRRAFAKCAKSESRRLVESGPLAPIEESLRRLRHKKEKFEPAFLAVYGPK